MRRRLHERYQRLLLDEFQDTDPIQIELAVRIAAAEPGAADAGRGPWADVAVAPGHLFVVGDPKQSIYRFRRADIATFLAARDRFGPEGGGVVQLTSNFRSTAPVIEWVNEVFARLMAEAPAVDTPVPSQPAYLALAPQRPAPPIGPPVAVVGRTTHHEKAPADDVRQAEAADVAATVVRIADEGWSVRDGDGWRPARLGDVTVLVPARTSLPFLQDALDAARIPFRAESSSLVYGTRAVRDLLMVLRAVADPTDQLHLLAALRTPLLGCGDDDLFRFRVERSGRWSYLVDQPDTMPTDDPVAAALGYLGALHRERLWMAPSDLIDRIVRDRRALELGFTETRPRDVWRRLRFVADQARAWSDATGGNLRTYLQWIEQQTAGARVEEAILPETDDDAVRVMTIHAAKGLEFPITIVSGPVHRAGRAAGGGRRGVPSNGRGGVPPRAARADRGVEGLTADRRADGARRADPPALRRLHARQRSPGRVAAPAGPQEGTRGEQADQRRVARRRHGRPSSTRCPMRPAAGTVYTGRIPPAATPIVDLAAWTAEHTAAVARAARPSAVAATALTDEGGPDPESDAGAGLLKRPPDLDLPPWLKGRYGTAVGRAVHGVLQTIDLATGDGAAAAVAAQCEAEAVPDRADAGRASSWPTRWPRRRSARRARGRTGVRCTPAPRSATACSRATSTCCTGATTGSSCSTTRRPPRTTPPSSTGASRATGCRAPATR